MQLEVNLFEHLNESEAEKKERNLKAALEMAMNATWHWQNEEGYIDIPDLVPNLKELRDAFVPVYRSRGHQEISGLFHDIERAKNTEFLGYELEGNEDNETARRFWQLINSDPRAFDLVADRLKSNIQLDFPLGGFLKLVASQIVSGELRRPPEPRGGKPPVVERDTLLKAIIERVKTNFGFHRASTIARRNDLEPMVDAHGKLLPYGAAIAWCAFEACGVKQYGPRALSLTQIAKKSGEFSVASDEMDDLLRLTQVRAMQSRKVNALNFLGNQEAQKRFDHIAVNIRSMFLETL